MGMIKSRGRVALAAITVVVICLRVDFLREWVLPLITLILALMAVREFHRLAVQVGAIFSHAVALAAGAGVTLMGVFHPDLFAASAILGLMAAMIAFFISHMSSQGSSGALTGVAAGMLCIVYVALPMALTLQVLQMDRLFLLFGLGLIWTADSGAYFAGSRWGRTKMAPALSPKKTWEGVAGGCVACIVVALLFKALVPAAAFPYPYLDVVILAIVISLIAPAGDLAESVLKRDCGVKDSGRGMAGHGGILDRIDSMLFCASIYYVYLLTQWQ